MILNNNWKDNFNRGVSYRKNSPAFTAKLRAKYQLSDAKKDVVHIYELERCDLSFLGKLLGNIKGYAKSKGVDDYSRQQVMEESLLASQKLLSYPKTVVGKTKILVAVVKENLCGIIVGNVPKVGKNEHIHYSSRKNHSKNETELDWIATWNPTKKSKLSGVGKVLTTEYFHSLKKDEFKNVYVRSELPELSFAQKFYESIGFSTLPSGRKSISKSSNNKYIIGECDTQGEEIIPMVASRSDIKNSIKINSQKYKRKELSASSEDLENLLK